MKICMLGMLLSMLSISLCAQEGHPLSTSEADRTAAKIFYLQLQADEAYEQGDYPKALAIWSNILIKDSTNADYFTRRSDILMRMERYDEAIADCDRVIELTPDSYWGYWQRAELLYAIQDVFGALDDLNIALALVDNDMDKYQLIYYRGYCKESLQDYKGALEDYATVLMEFDPENIKALNHMGIVLNYIKEHDEAIKYLSKAVLLAPENPDLYLSLGYTYQSIEEYERAIGLFNKAMDLCVGQPAKQGVNLNNRGYCKWKLGEQKAALQDINASLDLNPYNSYAYRNRALIYQHQGKKNKACSDIEAALDYGFTARYGQEMLELKASICQ